MAEVLKKECKLRELRPFRYGFSALKYERDVWEFEYTRDIIPDKFYVQTIYNKVKDWTYIVLFDMGFLGMFKPDDDDDVIVLKIEGKFDQDRLTNLYKSEPIYKAAIEELYNRYNDSVKKNKEEESA